MSVQDAHTSSLQDRQARFVEWSGAILYGLLGLGATLLVVLGVLYFKQSAANQNMERNRAAWDELFTAMKDAKKPEERLTALEGALPKVKDTPAYPYGLMEVAQRYFDLGAKKETPVGDRAGHYRKAKEYYEQVLKDYGDKPQYGPLAVEGAALAMEQIEETDNALKLLSDAAKRYDKHFLYGKISFDLARMYWMRSQKKDASESDRKADLESAERWIDSAVPVQKDKFTTDLDFNPTNYQQFMYLDLLRNDWRREALFLKSVMSKPGLAMPGGVAPPVRKETLELPAKNTAVPGGSGVPIGVPTSPGGVWPTNPTDPKTLKLPGQPQGGPKLPSLPALPPIQKAPAPDKK